MWFVSRVTVDYCMKETAQFSMLPLFHPYHLMSYVTSLTDSRRHTIVHALDLLKFSVIYFLTSDC